MQANVVDRVIRDLRLNNDPMGRWLTRVGIASQRGGLREAPRGYMVAPREKILVSGADGRVPSGHRQHQTQIGPQEGMCPSLPTPVSLELGCFNKRESLTAIQTLCRRQKCFERKSLGYEMYVCRLAHPASVSCHR